MDTNELLVKLGELANPSTTPLNEEERALVETSRSVIKFLASAAKGADRALSEWSAAYEKLVKSYRQVGTRLEKELAKNDKRILYPY